MSTWYLDGSKLKGTTIMSKVCWAGMEMMYGTLPPPSPLKYPTLAHDSFAPHHEGKSNPTHLGGGGGGQLPYDIKMGDRNLQKLWQGNAFHYTDGWPTAERGGVATAGWGGVGWGDDTELPSWGG